MNNESKFFLLPGKNLVPQERGTADIRKVAKLVFPQLNAINAASETLTALSSDSSEQSEYGLAGTQSGKQ